MNKSDEQTTPNLPEPPLTRADVLAIVHELVTQLRAPSDKDTARAAQIERFRKQQRQINAEQTEQKKRNQAQCRHLRIDGTSCIAWMTNSDGITRGVCMHCNRLFTPEDGEEYERLREISTLSPLQQAASAAIERVSK